MAYIQVGPFSSPLVSDGDCNGTVEVLDGTQFYIGAYAYIHDSTGISTPVYISDKVDMNTLKLNKAKDIGQRGYDSGFQDCVCFKVSNNAILSMPQQVVDAANPLTVQRQMVQSPSGSLVVSDGYKGVRSLSPNGLFDIIRASADGTWEAGPANNVADLIVGPLETGARFQTINAAVQYAYDNPKSYRQMIVVRAGLYVENVLLRTDIDIIGFGTDEDSDSVAIAGLVVARADSDTTTFTLRGLTVLGGLSVAGDRRQSVFIKNCHLAANDFFPLDIVNTHNETVVHVSDSFIQDMDSSGPAIRVADSSNAYLECVNTRIQSYTDSISLQLLSVPNPSKPVSCRLKGCEIDGTMMMYGASQSAVVNVEMDECLVRAENFYCIEVGNENSVMGCGKLILRGCKLVTDRATPMGAIVVHASGGSAVNTLEFGQISVEPLIAGAHNVTLYEVNGNGVARRLHEGPVAFGDDLTRQRTVNIPEASVGQFVAMDRAAGVMTVADPTSISKMPALGMVVSKTAEGACVIQSNGLINVATSFEVGNSVYVGADGYAANNPPANAVVLQVAGVVWPDDTIALSIPGQITIRKV